jgi:hypothetical protein
MRLSQPARTTKHPSPSIDGAPALPAGSGWRCRRRGHAQHLDRRPAFAPLVHSTSPKVNQPAAKPPRPEAVKARSRSRSMTTPVPLKAGASRSTPQRASPSAASQLPETSARPSGRGHAPATAPRRRRPAARAGSGRWPPAQQHALAGVGPVHPPDLDRRIVPAAVEDVGLGDPVRGQHALRVLRIDGQVRARRGPRRPSARFPVRTRCRRRTGSGRGR